MDFTEFPETEEVTEYCSECDRDNQKTDSCRFNDTRNNQTELPEAKKPVKREPQNTLITYLYRDACNYKVHNEAVVKGLITQEQEQRILNSLQEGEYFIPHLVGLPEKRFATETEDDHPFFEYQSVSHTNKPISCDRDVEELVKAFENCAINMKKPAAILNQGSFFVCI